MAAAKRGTKQKKPTTGKDCAVAWTGRMNIAAPLALQVNRGLHGYGNQKRVSLVVAALGLAVVLFALVGLRSTWTSAAERDARAECLVVYQERESDHTYGRCDQRCGGPDADGDGGYGGSGGREAAKKLLRSRVLNLGKAKKMDKTSMDPYWFAVVGDSIARNVLIALMETSGIDMETVTFERHQDFERVDAATNIRWTLHWAPFPENATHLLTGWTKGASSEASSEALAVTGVSASPQRPDAVVVSTSLWHVLWMHDVETYREDVGKLVPAIDGLRGLGLESTPVVLNGPYVFQELLEDAQKKKYMVKEQIVAYNDVLEREVCGGHSGGHPGGDGQAGSRRIKLVDVYKATAVCGAECSVDGIHSLERVYSERLVPMVLDGLE